MVMILNHWKCKGNRRTRPNAHYSHGEDEASPGSYLAYKAPPVELAKMYTKGSRRANV